MIKRSLATLASVVCLAACSHQVACGAVGCESGVSFDLTGVKASAGGPFIVHACIADACVDRELPDLTFVEIVTSDSATRTASASIDIRQGGKLLVSGSVPVTTRRSAPNGEACGPVCFYAGVIVTDAGPAARP